MDVLFPRLYNPDKLGHRKTIEPAKIAQTLDEIANMFGGYTLNDVPIIGSWVDPKTKRSMKDTHRSVWITTQNTPENIQRLKRLKEAWKKRFQILSLGYASFVS